jgi:hypothetical protein
MPSTQDDPPKAPTVFLSYSYDSREHRKWVLNLAERLVDKGVDVLLDQWDVGYGDDLPKYMERSVRTADRVLLICTEKYVHKADEGQGGVGYEAMIVTAELVRDLGQNKFIPVVRQGAANVKLPVFMGVRKYVNLSKGQSFSEQFEDLLRDIHKVPAVRKPKLGRNPFATTPLGEEIPPKQKDTARSYAKRAIEADGDITNEPAEAYRVAAEIAERDDLLGWRRLAREVQQPIVAAAARWRVKWEGQAPKTSDELPAFVDEGLKPFQPIMAMALAGVASGRKRFTNQVSLLDDILHPRDWNFSGLTLVVSLPEAAGWAYQALHGAAAVLTDQMQIALQLPQSGIEVSGGSRTEPMFRFHELMGWPSSLNGTCTIAWDYLTELPKRWPWIAQLFMDEETYLEALCAYYVALTVLEFSDDIAQEKHKDLASQAEMRFDVPPLFGIMSEDTRRRGYNLFRQDPEAVRQIWRARGLSEEALRPLWAEWIRLTKVWLSRLTHFGYSGRLPHERLFDDVP